MSVVFPKSVAAAIDALAAAGGPREIRAGGSDFMERRELGLTARDIVDLRDVAELDRIEVLPDGGHRIGARVTLRQLANEPAIARGYPALVLAANALATPQIRAVATLGGALLQRNRCWYYRSREERCLKSGGTSCPARDGDHHFGVCFDRGPCVSPHPSTMGMALLGYDARAEVNGRARPIADVFGDGSDGTRDHQLAAGELLTGIVLPAPLAGERGGYFRAIARAAAEWPLVEVSVRLVVDAAAGDVVRYARVSIGGVAPVPMRLPSVEAALEGTRGAEAFARAAALATAGATPLPQTAYKVAMIPGSVRETLERALAAIPRVR